MCGIIGVAGVNPIKNISWLSHGSNAMMHRGPDDSGEWWSNDKKVGLAHRRLSIIDLSEGGHQPMLDEEGCLSIIFNGEIYNFKEIRDQLKSFGHKFKSHSDTEVILIAYKEWGVNCLNKLNGMFAFSIYDGKEQKVFLARDRAGEKPLFYNNHGGMLRFSSELKGLFSDPSLTLKINHNALDSYLSMGFIPGAYCILEGFKKLPPGNALSFDLKTGNCNVWRYWELPEFICNQTYNENESILIDELENILEDSVRRQMIADVPVGVLLSGGVDSSLITAMAVRASNNVKTFTVGFPGHSKYDESEHARLIANHFGTQHTELMADLPSADLLLDLARQYDEPIIDSSMIPTFLVSQLIRKHCKVALGGDGGDELFGGYGHYSRLQWMQKNLNYIPGSIRKFIKFIGNNFLDEGSFGSNLRSWMIATGYDLDKELPQITKYFDTKTRKKLMGKFPYNEYIADEIFRERVPKNHNIYQRSSRMDFNNYLVEDILVKVDRASMLNSLEIRAPFLDHRLIEYAFKNIPSQLKATRNNKKILLKKLAAKNLPDAFDQNRKQGFSIPLDDWLKDGDFRDLFNEVLTDSSSIFDVNTTKNMLKLHDNGHSNGERLFGLVMFELWRKEYSIGL